jgi:GNAT superfamily N-acetyltransferase
MQLELRRAAATDSAALTQLARAAKASWDYPAEWLAAWEPELELTADYIRDHNVMVAEIAGAAVGVIGTGVGPHGPEIGHLWVAPDTQGAGVGRTLLEHAIAFARQQGWSALRIESDPFARPFYEHFGARYVGDLAAPVCGTPRTLPILSLPV